VNCSGVTFTFTLQAQYILFVSVSHGCILQGVLVSVQTAEIVSGHWHKSYLNKDE